MNIFQASSLLVIGLAALMAALASIAIGLSLLHASRQNVSFLFAPMLILLAACGVIDVGLSGRTLQTEAGAAISETLLQEVATKLPVKLLLGVLSGLALVALFGKAIQGKQRANFPFALAASFMAFYLATNPVPAAFGYEPLFLYALVYTPFILLALMVTTPANPQATLRVVKAALLLIVVSSLVAAVVVPSLALQDSAKAIIPGYGKRLWGMTSHANVLGPAALTLCLVEWAAPYRHTLLHRLCLLGGTGTLLLTQSKTSIIAALFALLILVSYRSIAGLGTPGVRTRLLTVKRDYVPMIALAVGIVSIVALLMAVLFGDDIGLFRSISSRLASFDLNTVQGRTLIWSQALTEGFKNPFFGYGLNLWSKEYRLATGLTSAFHAHNAFLQVFSVAGAFGLLAFGSYLAVLGKMSIEVASKSRGVSLALFGVLLVRSVAEVPIQFGAFTSADFISHLAFLFLVGTLRGNARASVAAAPRADILPPRPPLWKASYGRE